METHTCRMRLIAAAFLALGACTVLAAPANITLTDKGDAKCVIVVPEGTMAEDVKFPRGHRDFLERIAETRRQLQRDSASDLARCLEQMSGAKIEIVEALPGRERRVPIYIGKTAEKVFGPVGISRAGAFGFRVVASPRRGIGLYGESEHGTSYAIYELLHRLGCRWFMPTELGEVIPDLPTVTVPAMDEKRAPATEYRGMTQGGAEWKRRNRFTTGCGLGRIPGSVNRITYNGGRIGVHAGHNAFYRLIPKEKRAENPDWRLLVDGKPHSYFVRLTHPGVAEAMADTILSEIETHFTETLKAGYGLHYSLTLPDMQADTEDPYERKSDPDPRVWEPAAGRWSITDRYVLLANRIAEKVTKKYPNVYLGLAGYVNYSMPPKRYTPHSHITWMICPIDFNRHHPMTWPNHPNEYWLLDMVQAWGRQPSRLGYYAYGMNLAEITAPCPFITKWGTDIPVIMKNNLVYWSPETMNGWESMMPGYYLSARLTFDPTEKPEDILNDMWTRFYGAAAEPMSRYWHIIDRAWIDAGEYSGSHWGYLRMFTPEVLKAARAEVDKALALCRTEMKTRRVKLVDESFALFEQYMQMRRDWAAANLQGLRAQYEIWRAGVEDMQRRYKDPADPTCVLGRHGTLRYPDAFLRRAYEDASHMETDFARLGKPMLEWKWKHNPDPEAASLPWTAPDYEDGDWPATHVVRETWSTIGHHNTMTDKASGRSGRMVYRTSQKLGALPDGKKAYLWIGSTDGRAKLFVNGQHVKYVVPENTRAHKAGDVLDAFDGYCRPARFDVTGLVKPGDNQFTVLTERYRLNELGTGGVMGPVVVYREK